MEEIQKTAIIHPVIRQWIDARTRNALYKDLLRRTMRMSKQRKSYLLTYLPAYLNPVVDLLTSASGTGSLPIYISERGGEGWFGDHYHNDH